MFETHWLLHDISFAKLRKVKLSRRHKTRLESLIKMGCWTGVLNLNWVVELGCLNWITELGYWAGFSNWVHVLSWLCKFQVVEGVKFQLVHRGLMDRHQLKGGYWIMDMNFKNELSHITFSIFLRPQKFSKNCQFGWKHGTKSKIFELEPRESHLDKYFLLILGLAAERDRVRWWEGRWLFQTMIWSILEMGLWDRSHGDYSFL